MIWIQNFPSPRLVVLPRLDNIVSSMFTHSRQEEDKKTVHIFFTRALTQSETQTDSSQVADFIPYCDNRYSKLTI